MFTEKRKLLFLSDNVLHDLTCKGYVWFCRELVTKMQLLVADTSQGPLLAHLWIFTHIYVHKYD